MRTFKPLAIAVVLVLSPLLARAQSPTVPEPPPIRKDYASPEAESAPTAEVKPEVSTSSRPNGDLIEEYRIQGRLYMIKVTPPNGEPYYLVDDEGNREFRRSNEYRDPLTPPQWVLKRW